MYFAQITDTHIMTLSPSPFANRCPSLQLQNIINFLNTLSPLPQFVFLTGDCVHEGTQDEYLLLRDILKTLTMPYFIIPGNHDNRVNLKALFPHIPTIDDENLFIQFVIEDMPLRLIGLDSVRLGASFGEFCNRRLEWLDKTLSEDPTKPTLLFMHHPPIKCGIPVLDKNSNLDAPKFAQVLKKHPQVKHIFSGHFHRAIQTMWNHIPVTIAGSTVAQFAPNLEATTLTLSSEPPAFALHCWKEGTLITQFCSIPLE